MSTGHLKYETKPDDELYKILGENDTPKLYARPVVIDSTHSVAYGAGSSVNGKTVYVDSALYREIMDGKCVVKGMSPRQVLQAIIEHEHTEWSINAGDNACDVYQPSHEFATAKEHRFVRLLGVNPDRYEEAIRPALERALKRPQTNPPRDLWCGPYLDSPDSRDKEILRQYRAKGVVDAHKLSKFDVHYGMGPEECRDCTMFCTPKRVLSECEKVSGLVRADRHCDKWSPRKG